MQGRNGAVAAALAGLAFSVAVTVRAQTPPPQAPATQASQQTPPVQTPPAGEHGGEAPPRPQGQGQGQNRSADQARFPAHQRPAADPAVVARGKALFAGSCAACHGADARGGQLGGVNLLRSQLVLDDQDSELILPIVQNGRPGTQMPPIPLNADDVKAVATFLHDLQAKGSNQGGPPPGEGSAALDVVVGDAKAGADYFAATCSTCHSATGDLKGIATRIPDAKVLQNVWVSGGAARMRGPAAASARPVITTASVTLASGEKVDGRLVRLDDFLVTIAKEDGTQRTFARRAENDPKVEIADPLAAHRQLLSVYTDKTMHDVTAYLASLK